MKDWVIYVLLSLILGISIYNLFQKPKPEIDYMAMRKIQQAVLAEELKKIPRDSTIIERYHTIRTIRENRTVEFEQADSLKKDSLFWFYYLNWKQGND